MRIGLHFIVVDKLKCFYMKIEGTNEIFGSNGKCIYSLHDQQAAKDFHLTIGFSIFFYMGFRFFYLTICLCNFFHLFYLYYPQEICKTGTVNVLLLRLS